MIPTECTACGKPLLLANLFVDDGCPCNSPRGVNMTPRKCAVCEAVNCVKPGHHIAALFDGAVCGATTTTTGYAPCSRKPMHHGPCAHRVVR